MTISYTQTAWNTEGTTDGNYVSYWKDITVAVSTGDLIVVTGMSSNSAGGDAGAAGVRTQSGSTSAWQGVVVTATANHVGTTTGWATATGTGNVTVRVEVSANNAGPYMGVGAWVIPAAEWSGTPVRTAIPDSDADGAVSVSVGNTGSSVLYGAADWSAGGAGTMTPSGSSQGTNQTQSGQYTAIAAHWTNQASGTRSYGQTTPPATYGNDWTGSIWVIQGGGGPQTYQGAATMTAPSTLTSNATVSSGGATDIPGTQTSTGNQWASGTPATAQSAGSWAGATNATGANNATVATWTSTASGATGTITPSGFALQADLGGSAPYSIDNLAVTVWAYVTTNVSRMSNISVQLTDNGTPFGTPQNFTARSLTTTYNETFNFTGVTWAQLANLGVRVIFTRGAVTTSCTGNVDAIGINVTYTPVVHSWAAAVDLDAHSTLTANATVTAGGTTYQGASAMTAGSTLMSNAVRVKTGAVAMTAASTLVSNATKSGGGTTPPSFIGTTNDGGDQLVNSHTVSKHASATTGDLVILALWEWSSSGFGTLTDPTGSTRVGQWTVAGGVNGGNNRYTVVAKAVAAESNFTWTLGTQTWSAMTATFVHGWELADLTQLLINAASFSTSVNNFPSTSGTMAANSMAVWVGFNDQDGSGFVHTPPTNFTEQLDLQHTSVATKDNSSAGTVTASGGTVTGPSTGEAVLLQVPGQVVVSAPTAINSLVNTGNATGNNSTSNPISQSFISNTTVGSLVVGLLSQDNQGGANYLVSVADNGSNAYTVLTPIVDATSGQTMTPFYGYITSTSNVLTITCATNPVAFWAVQAVEYSGSWATSPYFDKNTSNNATNTTATDNAVSGTTATLSQASEFVVGVIADDLNAAVFSAGTGYTLNATSAATHNNNVAIESKVVADTAGVAATFTGSLASRYIAAVLTFKLSGGGPPVYQGASVMTAPSTLTVAATRSTSGAVAMTAASTLVSAATRTTAGASVMTAASVLVSAATVSTGPVTYQGAAAMTAASVLTTAAAVTMTAAVTMIAASTMASNAVVTRPAAVAMTASSALVSAAVRTTAGAVAMTAASTLVSAASVTMGAAVVMTAASTLVTAAVRSTDGSVTITAPSTLTVAGIRTTPGNVALTAPDVLVVGGFKTTSGASAMTAASSLTSDAIAGSTSTAFLTAPSTLTVAGFKTTAGAVNMTAPSAAVVAGFKTTAGASSMTAASVLVAAAVRATAAAVAMTGPSTLSATARATMFAAVAMTAMSTMVAAASIGAASTSPFKFWNGLTETPMTMKYWNGATEVPLASYSIAP